MNPRDPFESNGFQDRRFQPLTHSSAFNSNVLAARYYKFVRAWLRPPSPDSQPLPEQRPQRNPTVKRRPVYPVK